MNEKIIKLVRADGDLNKRKPSHQYLLIFLWLFYGLFYLYKGNFSFDNVDTFLGTLSTIFFIIFFIYTSKMISIYDTFQLVLNDNYIKYRYSLKNKGNIKLNELDHIQLKVLKIIFVLKNGEEKDFHLEDLSYKSVLEVKDEIKKFAENKNIRLT